MNSQYSIEKRKQIHKNAQNHSYSAAKKQEKRYSEPSPVKKKPFSKITSK